MRRPWAKASIFLYLVIARCRGQKCENPRRAKYLEITADNLKQGKWSLGYVGAVDWRAVSHRPRADIRGVKGAFSKVTPSTGRGYSIREIACGGWELPDFRISLVGRTFCLAESKNRMMK